MHHWGHPIHRITLAVVFFWFGLLKIFGFDSASSIVAHTIYLGSPEIMVPLLGVWEVAIGLCLLNERLIRIAIFLLAVRLPGVLLALVFRGDVCFVDFPLVPSPEGQYLLKDFLLFGAALVIGGTIRSEHPQEKDKG